MNGRPRAFVEAPAGLAAVSLCLQGGRHCRPPVSRMGNKAGYSVPILALAGLRPGRRADAYVWAELDADVRGLLRAYPDAAMLRQVADIIRGWAGEEPRALWERLRAERRERGAVGDAGGVAGWAILAQWAFRHGEPESGFGPSIVAVRPRTKTDHGSRGRTAGDEARLVEQAARAGWPPVAVLPTIPTAADLSAMLGTPGDLEGVVYYADPPYVGTTGYGDDLPREAVVRAALEAAAMGARVMVSEAVPVAELVAHGWHATDIGHTRRGAKRTFARVASEWVTSSFEPVETVGRVEQVAMFGAPP